MAYSQSNSATEPRAFSLGPIRVQIITFTVASGDTSGTVTADKLSTITDIVVASGLKLSAAPTLSGNTATLAFADPVATVAGTILAFGR